MPEAAELEDLLEDVAATELDDLLDDVAATELEDLLDEVTTTELDDLLEVVATELLVVPQPEALNCALFLPTPATLSNLSFTHCGVAGE